MSTLSAAEIKKLEKEAKEKAGPHFVLFKFGYHQTYVLPYEQGLMMMQALESYEVRDSTDYENPVIRSSKPSDDSPEISLISKESYLQMKMAHLLGMHLPAEPEENNP